MRILHFGIPVVAAFGLLACTGAQEGGERRDELVASTPSQLLGTNEDRLNRYLVHIETVLDWRVAGKIFSPVERSTQLCAGMIVGPRAIITDNHCIQGRTAWRTEVDGNGHPDKTPMVHVGHVSLAVWMHDKVGAKRKIADLVPVSQSSPYYGERVLEDQDLAVLGLPDTEATSLHDRECQFETRKLCARLPTSSVPNGQAQTISLVHNAGQVDSFGGTEHIRLSLSLGETWRNLASFESEYPTARSGNGLDWASTNYYILPDRGVRNDCGGGPFLQTGVFTDLLGAYRGSPSYDPSSTPDCLGCTGEVGYGTSFMSADVQGWLRWAVADLSPVPPSNDSYFDGAPMVAGGTDPGFFACCGDGVCEPGKGESRARCPADCPLQRCEDLPHLEGPVTYADGSPGYCKHGGYNLAYKIDGSDDHWAGGLNQPAYNWGSNDMLPVSAQLRFAGKFEWPTSVAPNDRAASLSSFNEILLKGVAERAFDMEFVRTWEFGWHASDLDRLTELFPPQGSCGACVSVKYPVGTLDDFNAIFGTSVAPRACQLSGVWHQQRWINGQLMALGAGSHPTCADWAVERVGLGFLDQGAPYAGLRSPEGNQAKFVYVFARDRRYLPSVVECSDPFTPPPQGSGSGGGTIPGPTDPMPVN